MIYVMKLNAGYYKNNIDKNSGSYEFRNVVNTLKDTYDGIVCDINEKALEKHTFFEEDDTIVLLAGLIDDAYRESIKKNLFKINCKKVLLITDLRVAIKCGLYVEDFKSLFDLVLDQLADSSTYNHIPEMFVTNEKLYTDKEHSGKMQAFVFGGNIDGRIEKFNEVYYSLRKEHVAFTKFIACKSTKAADMRLPYETFKSLSELYKYTFVISDQAYESENFVTSRFHEALDSNIVPFVESSYDKVGFMVPKDYKLLYSSGEELVMKLELMQNDPCFRMLVFEQLNELKIKAVSSKSNLIKAILR